jgi:aldehyde dehydrogenase (NAD+)
MVATVQPVGPVAGTGLRRLLDMSDNGILESLQRQYRRGERVANTPEVNPETRMLIDGKLVDAESGRTFENANPATEEVLGRVADGSTPEMHHAIAAARRAFDETDWSTDHAFRKHCLEQLQTALEAEQEELREQLILEAGAPRMLTHGPQLDAPLGDALRYPASLIDQFPWETNLGDATDFRGGVNTRQVVKEAVGVVGAIVPWNFPFEVTLNKLGQALATGNTMVLKPAPDTPWNATLIGRLVAEQTDIPAGVLNIVTSSDHLLGEELTLSAQVDLISFTGSTAVGKRIMERGAATLKRLFLELGGKSAAIVLDDADFATALMAGFGSCTHAGQGCGIQTRMLLPRSRYEEGVELLISYLAMVPYGDPQRPDVIMGPLISARQHERVLGYIDKGLQEGATLSLGGGRPKDHPTGWYVEPTLFTDVDNSMAIAREEIFGPVLCVIPFEDDDDAVRIANDSPYGLTGGVFAGTHEHAMAVSRRIRAGVLSVNGGVPYGADLPFGGYKNSGIGRQNGTAGFDQYLETKSLAWPAV